MKLYIRCRKCGEFIFFKTKFDDRFQLVKKHGEIIELPCKSCNSSEKYHVNEIKAESRHSISAIAMIILLAGTIAIFILVLSLSRRLASIYAIAGLFSLVIIPFCIYQAIHQSENEKVKYFNRKIYG